MLYLIGLGLDEKDISLKGLEAVKACNEIYLESYTSIPPSKQELKKLFKKEINLADRDFVESNFPLEKAKDNNIALLIPGDVFSATTHYALFQEAKKQNIPVKVIHNTSILTAVGITGLSLYKFGQTVSIPSNYKEISSPYENFLINYKNNLHTLFLLDLDLTINKALEYLITKGLNKNTSCIICEHLGSKEQKIKKATAESLLKEKFSQPFCLIIPAKKLHFTEEEAISKWK